MAKADKAPAAASAGEPRISLAQHPRAQRHIALAKAWGGLAVFGLVLWLATSAGLPLPDALLRALLFGIAGRVVAWALAVAVWRQLAVAELEAARRRLVAARDAAAERARAREVS